MRYAVVDGSGNVVNLIEWDGVAQWAPPAGHTAEADPNGDAWIGGTWDGQAFSKAPPPPPAPPPTADQLLNQLRNAESDRIVWSGLKTDTPEASAKEAEAQSRVDALKAQLASLRS